MMRFQTLAEWLAWQETLHPASIELKLERISSVWRRLQPEPPTHAVITVGGTNGKGSCVAYLEAMLRAAGYKVGAYTSPHLLRYNERIRINGQEADDAAICGAFARIDVARGADSLTYFEFGTLAALTLFREAAVEVAILEVGLGGRLDAVNILDADVALVTNIALDHMEWLGPDREHIGYEKAGIYRPGRPAVCADPDPPRSLLDQTERIGARLLRVNRDYCFTPTGATWRWQAADQQLDGLPWPNLAGAHQLGNAAAALMALTSLGARWPVTPAAIAAGLRQAQWPARFQVIPGPVSWILDVAHNPAAAAVLAAQLKSQNCPGRTQALIGVLADKDADGLIQALIDVVDFWRPVTLPGPRGRSSADLAARLRSAGVQAIAPHDSVEEAAQAAREIAQPGDRIVTLGSFHLVAPILAAQPWLFAHAPSALRET